MKTLKNFIMKKCENLIMIPQYENSFFLISTDGDAICKIYKHDVDRKIQVKFVEKWLTFNSQKDVIEFLQNSTLDDLIKMNK